MKRNHSTFKSFKLTGVSLIELAIALVIIGIALIPMVIALSGSKQGLLISNTRTLLQEKTVANTLMEKAVGQDPEFVDLLKSKNVLIQRNPDYKIITDITTFPESKIKYRWIFKNITYSEYSGDQMLPDGNYLIEASLELYRTDLNVSEKKPSLTLGTKLLVQEPTKVEPEPYIGVMILLDMTPSMANSIKHWGSNPLKIEDMYKNEYNNKVKADPSIIPDFSDEDPKKVLNFLNKYCKPRIKYANCFAQPYHKYTNNDDFLFGENTDNPNTDFNEKYVPSTLILNAINTLAAPEKAVFKPAEYFKLIKSATETKNDVLNDKIVNSTIPKIEMLRSSLYSYVHLIEKTHEGIPNHLKMGFLPFASTVNKSFMLEPTLPDPDGKYRKLQKYIKSINRDRAPINYGFDLISNNDYSTDIPGAIRLAHETLIKDKTLTKRVIILITDWNHCIEPPKTIDIEPVRNCILEYIKVLKTEELKTRLLIKNRLKNSNTTQLKPDDPLAIRLSKLMKSAKTLKKLLIDYDVNKKYQPYFPLYDETCKLQKTSQPLNDLSININEGLINGADGKSTDLYVLGIIDAARPPAAQILANMTTSFENGEYFAAKDIKQIPQLFYYLVLEMNRLEKLEETKRYAYNKKLRYGRKSK